MEIITNCTTGEVIEVPIAPPTPEEIAAAAERANRVPESVTPYQMEMALLSMGLSEAVEAFVNGPGVPLAAKIAWNRASTFYRDSPLIDFAKTGLGWTDAQIDDLFRLANTVG